MHSNYNVSSELSYLKDEVQELRLDQEKNYTKKAQIIEISSKLDKIDEKVNTLTVQVSTLKVKLRSLNHYLSARTCEKPFAFNLLKPEGMELWN
jgi:predicted transcriptional regulator